MHSRQLSAAGGPAYAEINELATLLLQPQEEALLQLFSRGTSDYFSLTTLAAFSAIYFGAAIFTYGIFVPSGLFVPCMLTGTLHAFPRLFSSTATNVVTTTTDCHLPPQVRAWAGSRARLCAAWAQVASIPACTRSWGRPACWAASRA